MVKVLACVEVETGRASDHVALFAWLDLAIMPGVGDSVIFNVYAFDSLMTVKRRAISVEQVTLEFAEKISRETATTLERLGFTYDIPES